MSSYYMEQNLQRMMMADARAKRSLISTSGNDLGVSIKNRKRNKSLRKNSLRQNTTPSELVTIKLEPMKGSEYSAKLCTEPIEEREEMHTIVKSIKRSMSAKAGFTSPYLAHMDIISLKTLKKPLHSKKRAAESSRLLPKLLSFHQ